MSNDILTARKFNAQDYFVYDAYAKNRLLVYLSKRGHSVIKDEEDYQHDIVTEKENIRYYFEVEVKKGYSFISKETYKYDTVSFLGRKKRLHEIKPFIYVIICHETGAALYCTSNVIYNEAYKKTINVNTTTRQGIDEVYRVPIDHCQFFII